MTISEIIQTVYDTWGKAVKAVVKNNYSMGNSSTTPKFPYASLKFLGFPTNSIDTEGNEGTVNATVQIELYTTGQKMLTKVYALDQVSHASMQKMCFRRTYGPELMDSGDPSITRLVSRYSRNIGYGDSIIRKE